MAAVRVIDCVRPVCPGWHQHYQMRRWVASLPSCAWVEDDFAFLIVKPSADPCSWYITREDLLTPWQRLQRTGGSMMDYFLAGMHHAFCRSTPGVVPSPNYHKLS